MAYKEPGAPGLPTERLSEDSRDHSRLSEDSRDHSASSLLLNLRLVRVVILRPRIIDIRRLTKAPPPIKDRRIAIHGGSTFGGVQRKLQEGEQGEWTTTVLHANYSDQPYWDVPAVDSIIAADCHTLYAVNTRRDTQYLLALVRSPQSDYPLAIAQPPENRPLNIIQAVTGADPSLDSSITSITNFTHGGIIRTDMRTTPYDYNSLKQRAAGTFPTVLTVTIGNPSGQLQLDIPPASPPFLQIPLVNCQALLWRTYSLKKFSFEMIYLSRALLHAIISLARVLDPAEGDPRAEDVLQVSAALADNLQRLLDRLKKTVGDVENGHFVALEVQNVIEQTYRDLCGDLPGAVNIRHSKGTFDKLKTLDKKVAKTPMVAETVQEVEESPVLICQHALHGVESQELMPTATVHIPERPLMTVSDTTNIVEGNVASTAAEFPAVRERVMIPVDILPAFKDRRSSQAKELSRDAVVGSTPISAASGDGLGFGTPFERTSSGTGQGSVVRNPGENDQNTLKNIPSLFHESPIGRKPQTYFGAEQYNEAEAFDVDLLRTCRKNLGTEHPNTIAAAANLAATYSNQGRYDEAEKLELGVLEKRRNTLGTEDLETVAAAANLAVTYFNQGRYDESERLELEILEMRRKILGADHPDTIAAAANLAATYSAQGRYDEAERLGSKVLEKHKKIFGPDHPDTIAAAANLVVIYSNQGRHGEAEKLELEVLEKRRKILGPEHPSTIVAAANLASTYSAQGRYDEAEKLDLEVLEKCRNLLGANHSDTVVAAANLATTYRSQGRLDEAEKLEVYSTQKLDGRAAY